MAKPLTQRIEEATEAIVATRLPSWQVLTFGEPTEADADYIAVNAVPVAEDPPMSGVFAFAVEVILHGNPSAEDVHTLEELMDNGNLLAVRLREQGAGAFTMPQGQAVEIDAGSKAGAQLDEERRYAFTAWAQAQEVTDAAA